jgi:hypothetical protein
MIKHAYGASSADGESRDPRELTEVSDAQVSPGRPLKIIGREPLSSSIDAAVERALARHLKGLSPERQKAIRDSVRSEFLRLIRRNGRRIRGMSRSAFLLELSRARNRTLLARDAAREELLSLLQDLDRAKRDRAKDRKLITLDELAAVDLSDMTADVGELFERAKSGELSMEELREAVLARTARAAKEEIEKSVRHLSEAYARKVDQFERRIQKLTLSLEATEQALAEMSRLKNVDPGVSSIYRVVQGLKVEDPLWQAKEEMLAQLFEANLVLQGK